MLRETHMSDVITNAMQKFDEAVFYLNLMDRIECERSSLTKDREAATEFSYLLSAFLNACYSCTEHLIRDKSNEDIIREFKKHQHPDFYASGSTGGWRTKAVHYKPVIPEHYGYIRPPCNNAIIRFKERRPYTSPKGDSVNFQFESLGKFYFSNSGAQNSICDICFAHLNDLKELINTCICSCRNSKNR
jgi:hypothetical protein